jgi:hypothetical protein
MNIAEKLLDIAQDLQRLALRLMVEAERTHQSTPASAPKRRGRPPKNASSVVRRGRKPRAPHEEGGQEV